MKKLFYLFTVLSLFGITLPACTELQSGDTFITMVQGVEYKCEVIVSKMNYVRISPIAKPEQLSGAITIPSTVKYDGDNFIVTQVAKEAFKDYANLSSVTLPSTLSVIEDGAFQGCISLQTINTPQPLSTIGKNAFDGCVSLEYFDLEASLSTLGTGCFRNCTKLSGIKFPSSFSEIPNEAFYGCTSLENIALPATIMQIGDRAFAYCKGVSRIIMDRSVQNIGDGAFYNCLSVESITCLTATPPTCYNSTFEGIATDIPVTVPMAHVNDYKSAIGWNHFTNFQGTY